MAMVKTAREARSKKLYREGKERGRGRGARSVEGFSNTSWAADANQATNFLKQVYNSFKRS